MEKEYSILQIDPYLLPYKPDIVLRMNNYEDTKKRLCADSDSLSEFANGHLYYGFQKHAEGWYYREWAPNAREIALTGDFNSWDRTSHKLKQVSDGVWEIFIPGTDTLSHLSKVKIEITTKDGQKLDRIPLYCKRVIQEPGTNNFNGQIWQPDTPFAWTDEAFDIKHIQQPLIYESHVGMSGLKEEVTSFKEFIDTALPRIKNLGYNTIQLMAIAEHPYYGSFGYQVSNFYAVSSRFGTPDDLKLLINTAHREGIAVLLDIVHSHAAKNFVEGIGAFDGTEHQFFHSGSRGNHPAWGTKLFNYGKPEVLHFLLSNVKFWLDEYHFDGFRFDGITSMLYHDHGLGGVFDNYNKYFSLNTDTEAITYLQLAAELSKEVKPGCILIAEDMSGLPGMCLPIHDGGIGFDYRLGMGIPDYWVRTLRDKRDEDWDMGQLWYELSQRRPKEKVIGYCESHDQALVGDKTIMFWLADKEMYWHMSVDSQSHVIDRAMALHKMIRLLTCLCAGEGYLNFMGNEFGHPEWVDFPREGNGWSHYYARRRWDLADNENLRYHYLQNFDKAMINLVSENNLLISEKKLLYCDNQNKILIFSAGSCIFAFNFHPHVSHTVEIAVPPAIYQLKLHSEQKEFGGLRHYDSGIQPASATNDALKIHVMNRTAAVYQYVLT